MEKHSDGGYHYHASLKLSGTKKWLEAKRTLETQHRISVHFSHHDGYYSAYWYISKYDKNIFYSTGHPNLDEVGSPRTKNFQNVYRKRRSTREPGAENGQGSSTSTKKLKRLSNLDVSDLIVKYKINSETALLAVANKQRQKGKKGLANYVLSGNTKSLNDVIKQTWKMKEVSSDLKRQQASRIELIRKAADAECLQDCDGEWLKCAQEVLINNKVHPILFAAAMRDLLQFGRGKHRNIIS